VRETVSRLKVAQVSGFDRNHYPLSMNVIPEPQLLLKIIYNAERFGTHGIGRMFELLELLLRRIVTSSESTLADLLEAVDKVDKEQKLNREQEREKFNFSKLIKVK